MKMHSNSAAQYKRLDRKAIIYKFCIELIVICSVTYFIDCIVSCDHAIVIPWCLQVVSSLCVNDLFQ